jgi:hypothetical protein
MKTALFVDIDGVLHPMSAIAFDFVDREMVIGGEDLLRWAPILWDLIQPFDVPLIVHSSWRHIYRLDEIVSTFPLPIRSRILDVTSDPGRYEGIVSYVERHRIERFAVLDDMPGAFPPGWPHLITCDPELGISAPDVQERIKRFLEGPGQ